MCFLYCSSVLGLCIVILYSQYRVVTFDKIALISSICILWVVLFVSLTIVNHKYSDWCQSLRITDICILEEKPGLCPGLFLGKDKSLKGLPCSKSWNNLSQGIPSLSSWNETLRISPDYADHANCATPIQIWPKTKIWKV